MRVQFSFVGTVERHENIYVEMDAVPQEGDTVDIPGVSQADTVVRTVVWHPLGEDGSEGPFVYVVLGRRRPG